MQKPDVRKYLKTLRRNQWRFFFSDSIRTYVDKPADGKQNQTSADHDHRMPFAPEATAA
jgi:hypothetical protein